MEISRQYFKKVLSARIGRLNDLMGLDAPDVIVANELLLVIQAACGYCPEEMSKVLQHTVTAQVRRAAGFCVNCDNKVIGSDLCSECKERSYGDQAFECSD